MEINIGSGGSLAMEKCNFYTARWNFHNSGRPEMKDCQVKIMHFQDIGTVINSIVCHHKTLGYYISPSTPGQSQRLQWQEIENRFGTLLDSYNLSHRETNILYKQIYIPTIRYLLPYMILPEAEILRITKPTITKFLRCQGYYIPIILREI